MTTEQTTTDDLLDFADTVINTPAKAARRDRAMEKAHAAGHQACEVCGRAITGTPDAVIEGSPVGPTCARKARKAGLAL
jgi:hypothetical protein